MIREDEYIEVPVTRQARVTLIGVYDSPAMALLNDGDLIALKPRLTAPWRPGTHRVRLGWLLRDDVLRDIPTAAVGDYVYRVEPA